MTRRSDATEWRNLKAQFGHGTFCYPGGRSIEIVSGHPEWTAWAVQKLYEAARAEKESEHEVQEAKSATA